MSKAYSKSKMKVSTCLPLKNDFIPVVYNCDQLSFTAMLFQESCCLPDKSICSSKRAIIFEQTICSSNLQGTQVRETG